MEGVDDRGRAASDCGSRVVRSRRKGNLLQQGLDGRRWADPIVANARASAWPFERGRRAVRARPRGSRGITACARAKRRVEGGLGGCQAFLGRLHLAVDDRAQVIVLVTIIVTVIVIVVGLRRRARFAGACKIKPARVQSASCTRSLATPRPALLVWMWTTVGLESLTCGARPSIRAPRDWGHARGSPDPMEKTKRADQKTSR